jgi:hypothetical protein
MSTNVMSEPQASYLGSLISARSSRFPAGADAILDALRKERITGKGASALITEIKALPEDALPAGQTPARRSNKYGGNCHLCGGYVPAQAGYLAGSPGNWASEHKEGECVGRDGIDAILGDLPNGFYAVPRVREDSDNDLSFFEISDRNNDVRRFAGSDTREVTIVSGGDHNGKVMRAEWVKDAVDAVRALGVEASMRLYGTETNHCCKCHRLLTSEWRHEGIGPECFKGAGW